MFHPNCFFPKPKVTSTVIYFKPNKKFLEKLKILENLEKITQFYFQIKEK